MCCHTAPILLLSSSQGPDKYFSLFGMEISWSWISVLQFYYLNEGPQFSWFWPLCSFYMELKGSFSWITSLALCPICFCFVFVFCKKQLCLFVKSRFTLQYVHWVHSETSLSCRSDHVSINSFWISIKLCVRSALSGASQYTCASNWIKSMYFYVRIENVFPVIFLYQSVQVCSAETTTSVLNLKMHMSQGGQF